LCTVLLGALESSHRLMCQLHVRAHVPAACKGSCASCM
jgi:hypothetical protein